MDKVTWIMIYMCHLESPLCDFSIKTTQDNLHRRVHLLLAIMVASLHPISFIPLLCCKDMRGCDSFTFWAICSSKAYLLFYLETSAPRVTLKHKNISFPQFLCLHIPFILLLSVYCAFSFPTVLFSPQPRLFPGFWVWGMSKPLPDWELNLASFRLTACARLYTPPFSSSSFSSASMLWQPQEAFGSTANPSNHCRHFPCAEHDVQLTLHTCQTLTDFYGNSIL